MQKKRTKSGMLYTWDLESIEGAGFILYPDPGHDKKDIQKARAEIRDSQDVVSFRVADEDDRDYLFRSDIFDHPLARPLQWYEIEQDPDLIRDQRLNGTSPEQFIKEFVLPFTERTKARNIERFGDHMITQ